MEQRRAKSSGMRDVAGLFAHHGFTSLPVVGEGGRFLGIIFQLHLIASDRRVQDAAGFLPRIRNRLLPHPGTPARAADVMEPAPPCARPDTPIAALLPQLAGNGMDAVPVLNGPRIVGIVTQTDLIAALARQSLRAGSPVA